MERDKLIASLEQERALSRRGLWRGFSHVGGRKMFDGFTFHFSQAQLRLYCQPLQPWKGLGAEKLNKGMNVWAHAEVCSHKTNRKYTQTHHCPAVNTITQVDLNASPDAALPGHGFFFGTKWYFHNTIYVKSITDRFVFILHNVSPDRISQRELNCYNKHHQ